MRLGVLLSLLQVAGVYGLPYANEDIHVPWSKQDAQKSSHKLSRAVAAVFVNPVLQEYKVESPPAGASSAPEYSYVPPVRPQASSVLSKSPPRLPYGTIGLQRTTTLEIPASPSDPAVLPAASAVAAAPVAPVASSSSTASSSSLASSSSVASSSSADSSSSVAPSSSVASSITVISTSVVVASSAVTSSSSEAVSSSEASANAVTSLSSAVSSDSVATSSSVASSSASITRHGRPSQAQPAFSPPAHANSAQIPPARLTHFPIPVAHTTILSIAAQSSSSTSCTTSVLTDSGSHSAAASSSGATDPSSSVTESSTSSTPAVKTGMFPPKSSLTRAQTSSSSTSTSTSSDPAVTVVRTVESLLPVTETSLRTLTATTVRVESIATTVLSILQAGRKPSVTVLQPTTSGGTTKTVTIMTTLTVSETQRVTVTTTPNTMGTINSSLNTEGQNTIGPVHSVTVTNTQQISPLTAGPSVIGASSTKPIPSSAMSGDIFVPIASNAPPSQITTRGNHPVPRTGIVGREPFQTNKFYSNFYLGTRTQSTWTHPYSVAWVGGGSPTNSWGLSISHVNRNQTVYGPGDPGHAQYFINPLGIQSIIMSAQEIEAGANLTMDSLKPFSVNINLLQPGSQTPLITFPLVQGMGFVTGIYNNATPLLQSSVFFKTIVYGGAVASSTTVRYVVTLMDGTVWFVYLTPSSGSSVPTLTLLNTGKIVGNKPFIGSIQVAKNPNGASSQTLYDASAGVYPLRGAVHASVSQATGSYSLSWVKGGVLSRSLLMFALPHHVQSLRSPTARAALQLITTTKGIATAVVGDSWQLVENDLPYDMGFAPWSPTLRSQTTLPANARTLISSVSAMELNEDMNAQTNLNSMYFSGKGLAKFAFTVFAANNLANNRGAASAGLVKLKSAFSRFVNNTQIIPLVYDSSWGGAVSSIGYTAGQDGQDFGNTYYNDHHFHYGYFVYTAAVIGFLDPNWLTQGTNKAWVDMLVRDYANPATNDPYFPFSRMFDWYHGHSWAHGLYETADGKDEESSSEDAFSSYALKMWGRTTKDANMEARGNLMLAIQARSLNNYFLLQSNNTVEPANFVQNKVSGILFENKMDHTTYFGTRPEYIEGIHMIPLNPSSTLTRRPTFVQQEWDQYFSGGRANSADGGWVGILYANLAIIDPKTAYNFFASPSFSSTYLDGGASRSWYLAFCAGLGGAS